MRTIVKVLGVAFLALSLAACATLQATKAPSADLSTIKTVYVQKVEGDGYNVYQVIAARLNAMGFKATSGASADPPEPVDAIVTYVDRWMWDLTMYMIRLNIQVRDGKTRSILASGESYRPSLERRSAEEMVAETLDAIFKR
ncbi:MAG: hypothetical protein NTY44_00835 [Deltaproteobacteria bacterium]|nr:hypothetical protein [Deltaproteobacteria bacterium]